MMKMTKLDITCSGWQVYLCETELQKVLYELEKKDFNFSLRNQAVVQISLSLL